MYQDSLVLIKSKAFALRIIKFYKYLYEEKHENVMSKQVLRCGTSIGANVAEALTGISINDFYAKIYISFKESHETKYWLELLHESDYLDDSQYNSIYSDCKELIKLLSSITKTTREKILNKNQNLEKGIPNS